MDNLDNLITTTITEKKKKKDSKITQDKTPKFVKEFDEIDEPLVKYYNIKRITQQQLMRCEIGIFFLIGVLI